jgi:hypothetical protein
MQYVTMKDLSMIDSFDIILSAQIKAFFLL